MKRKRTPYQRIRDAAARGGGCRLTPDECFSMGTMDDAVFTRAQLDDEDALLEKIKGGPLAAAERAQR